MPGRESVLVIGATGTVGSALVDRLLSKGVHVRALVHEESRADRLTQKGVEVRAGDLNNPDSLHPAFDGIGKVYLLTPNGPAAVAQAGAAIDAARTAGVDHIVRQSGYGSARSRIIQDHLVIDAGLSISQVPYTLLRPTFFMQNVMMAAQTVASDGVIYMPFKQGRVGMIDVRDIADVAADVLTTDGHEGKSYVLTGPASISFHDVADALQAELGKKVSYVDVPPEAGRTAIAGMGIPEWVADGYIELFSDFAENWGNHVSADFQLVTGKPGRTIAEFAHDFAPVFQHKPVPAG